jgi:hypothetical protein
VRGRLELRETARDLSHLLSHLGRRVVSHPDGEQPQRPVTQLLGLDRGREPERTLRAHADIPETVFDQLAAAAAPLTEPPPSERALMIAPPPRRAARAVDGTATDA